MKILILSAGNSVHTIKWVNTLAKREHEVYLVYNKGHEPQNGEVDENVVCICLKHGGNAGYFLNAGQLRKIEKQIRPEVINVHFASGYGTLARKAKIGPILLSIWGSDVYDFPNKSIIHHKLIEKNVMYASMLASTSECMAKQLRKVMGQPEMDISITPFGVDLKLFDSHRFNNTNENRNIVIGNIKMLKPKYGIDKLIKAVSILEKRLQNQAEDTKRISLKIYGEGNQKEELEELVKKLELGDIVSFEGYIPNTSVPEKLNEFDIFCAVSQLDSESFGVAVVEAMAMQIPVVVSDVDGFKEVVNDGETGIVVSKEDVVEIASALEKLVMDSNLRKEYGMNGRKRVEQLFDWERNVNDMEQLYCILRDRRY
ncbi:glycosyltransferase [Extibacter muris]|uniref:glycosyltransferase n=1 Tax=Extibacter muris TaxID=1796622 RepID=UPI001D071B60|nr:glycosyltransferase [Extibacter muris]MCB6203681.1 glycosyltransferase [Extibacter muris]MCQ4665235.1 glycosyltransferase [Extibacter muris]MCQ4694649.1 glycosyltransferase [Extibacter muris]